MEIWKPVKDFEGIYEVSNQGRVKSLSRKDKRGHMRNEIFLKPTLNPRGYLFVVLQDKKSKVIHRLVAEAFIPNPYNKAEVNHKSGIKTDNNLSNLEWATHSENILHSCKNGLRKTVKGQDKYNATLTNSEATEIRTLYSTGKWTYKKLAEKFGVKMTTVAFVVTNRSYKL